MTTIQVTQYNDEIHLIYDMLDQRFYCTHPNMEIDTDDLQVICYDCDNEDFRYNEENEIVYNYLVDKEDMLADYETAEYLERSN